jgi:hypothetical protein
VGSEMCIRDRLLGAVNIAGLIYLVDKYGF